MGCFAVGISIEIAFEEIVELSLKKERMDFDFSFLDFSFNIFSNSVFRYYRNGFLNYGVHQFTKDLLLNNYIGIENKNSSFQIEPFFEICGKRCTHWKVSEVCLLVDIDTDEIGYSPIKKKRSGCGEEGDIESYITETTRSDDQELTELPIRIYSNKDPKIYVEYIKYLKEISSVMLTVFIVLICIFGVVPCVILCIVLIIMGIIPCFPYVKR